LCGDHIRRLGEIYRSRLPETEKARAFEAGLRDTSNCHDCLPRRSGDYLPRRMKVKICLLGETSSEKSAILAPVVQALVDDRYIQTLGTQVSKKQLVVPNPTGSGDIHVDMIVWNVLGHGGFRELLREAYFLGSKGALFVADGTRRNGLGAIDGWASGLFDVTGKIPMAILVNTKGQARENVTDEAVVASKAKSYEAPYFYSSTETRENVELAFHNLAERIVGDRVQRSSVTKEELDGKEGANGSP